MNKLEEIIKTKHDTQSDINEHIPTIVKYAKECNHITEFGVRWVVSTWAFLGGYPYKMISYDKDHPSVYGIDIQPLYDISKEIGVDFTFIQADVTTIEIEKTDLLFIDTWHVYDQMKKELELHASKVMKYIMFHDTTTFEFIGESAGHKGIWYAISEFLNENPNWVIHERFTNNNGLTILKRIS